MVVSARRTLATVLVAAGAALLVPGAAWSAVAVPDATSSSTSSTEAPTCPTTPRDRIITHWYIVNGKVVSDLTAAGNVAQGATIKYSFDLAPGCENQKVGIATYTAPSDGTKEPGWPDHLPPDFLRAEKYFDSDVKTFDAGRHLLALTVTVPDCFYEVDAFVGDVITQFNPDSPTGKYTAPPSRLTDTALGGVDNCVPDTTTTTQPNTTTTAPHSTTTAPNSSTTSPTVLGTTVVNNPTTTVAGGGSSPTVLGESETKPASSTLASTGIFTLRIAGIGAILLLVGLILRRGAASRN
jgi:hypothetical protein